MRQSSRAIDDPLRERRCIQEQMPPGDRPLLNPAPPFLSNVVGRHAVGRIVYRSGLLGGNRTGGWQTKQERKLLKFVAEPNAGEGLVDATVELRRPGNGFDSRVSSVSKAEHCSPKPSIHAFFRVRRFLLGGAIFLGSSRSKRTRYYKSQFPKILRLESRDLQFNGNEAIEAAMEEQQIEREVLSSTLYWIFRADEAKITAQFNQKLFQLPQETSM
jgi:hypothetical protein